MVLLKAEITPWNGEEYAKTRDFKSRKWREDFWARIFSLFRECNLQRLQSMQEELDEVEESKQQKRLKIMKDLTKKIRSEDRMDAESRWWVTELFCGRMSEGVGPSRMGRQQKVAQMMKSAEGSAGLLHKITKPTAWREGAQILKK